MSEPKAFHLTIGFGSVRDRETAERTIKRERDLSPLKMALSHSNIRSIHFMSMGNPPIRGTIALMRHLPDVTMAATIRYGDRVIGNIVSENGHLTAKWTGGSVQCELPTQDDAAEHTATDIIRAMKHAGKETLSWKSTATR